MSETPTGADASLRHMETREEIFYEVSIERNRQDSKWGGVPGIERRDDHTYAAVLGEEFGEVCKAWLERDVAGLREELVQTAAVAIAWIEELDNGGGLVGERDKALLMQCEAALTSLEVTLFGNDRCRSRDELDERAEELVKAGERDRRQIARLTEALDEARGYVGWCEVEWPSHEAVEPREFLTRIDAVLADKEDAATRGENFAAVVQEARRLMAYGTEDEVIAFLIGKPVEVVSQVSGSGSAGEEDT